MIVLNPLAVSQLRVVMEEIAEDPKFWTFAFSGAGKKTTTTSNTLLALAELRLRLEKTVTPLTLSAFLTQGRIMADAEYGGTSTKELGRIIVWTCSKHIRAKLADPATPKAVRENLLALQAIHSLK